MSSEKPTFKIQPRTHEASGPVYSSYGDENPRPCGQNSFPVFHHVRYRLEERVAGGTFGEVYRAKDCQLDRLVAIKFLKGSADRRSFDRVEREARALAKFQHSNIVNVYEFIPSPPCIVMEFVVAGSLESAVNRRPLPMREALDVFLQIGEGLASVHRAGFVHRDVSYNNILLATDGAKLADFGSASEAPGERLSSIFGELDDTDPGFRLVNAATAARRSGGTKGFRSPEGILLGQFDAKSDQFSFCACLYWAIYKKFAHDEHAMLRAIKSKRELEPDFAGNPRLPARLRRVLARGLALDRTRRYPSMDALLVDLRHCARPWNERFKWEIRSGVAVVMTALAAGILAEDNPCLRAVSSYEAWWDGLEASLLSQRPDWQPRLAPLRLRVERGSDALKGKCTDDRRWLEAKREIQDKTASISLDLAHLTGLPGSFTGWGDIDAARTAFTSEASGQYRRGLQAIARLLAVDIPPLARARTLYTRGRLYHHLGMKTEALEALTEALVIARDHNDPLETELMTFKTEVLAAAKAEVGASLRDRVREIDWTLQRRPPLRVEGADEMRLDGHAHHELARGLVALAEARSLVERSEAEPTPLKTQAESAPLDALGDPQETVPALLDEALEALQRGANETAYDPLLKAKFLFNLAWTYAEPLGERPLDRALDALDVAETLLRRDWPQHPLLGKLLNLRGWIFESVEAYEKAATNYSDAWRQLKSTDETAQAVNAAIGLGRAMINDGRIDELLGDPAAAGLIAEAEGLAVASGAPHPDELTPPRYEVRYQNHEYRDALRIALDAAARADHPGARARALGMAGEAKLALGERTAARDLLTRALAFGQNEHLVCVHTALGELAVLEGRPFAARTHFTIAIETPGDQDPDRCMETARRRLASFHPPDTHDEKRWP